MFTFRRHFHHVAVAFWNTSFYWFMSKFYPMKTVLISSLLASTCTFPLIIGNFRKTTAKQRVDIYAFWSCVLVSLVRCPGEYQDGLNLHGCSRQNRFSRRLNAFRMGAFTMSSVKEFQLSTTQFEKLFALTNKRDLFLNNFNEWPRVAEYLFTVKNLSLSNLSIPCMILYTWIMSDISLLYSKPGSPYVFSLSSYERCLKH